MSSTPDDELISAYLDDELNEAERARVEAMLAEQPETRQLLEDLRALRGGLEGLPVHRLDDSFVDRVMRSAERELLSGVAPDADVEHGAGEPMELRLKATEGRSSEPALREELRLDPAMHGWRRFRRPLAWAGAALAAGLLLMAFERTPPAGGPQVAQAPRDATPSDAAWQRKEERESVKKEALAEAPTREAQAAKDVGERSNADRLASPAAEEAQRMLGGKPPAAKQPAPASPRMAGKAAAATKSAAPPGRGGFAAGAPAPDAKAKQAAMPRALGERFRKLDQLNADQNYFGYDMKRIEDGKLIAEPLDEKTLIVWCDVDQDVADRPEFRQLLASNRIAWASSGEQTEKPQAAANDKDFAEKSAQKKALDDSKPAAKPASPLGLAERKAAAGEKAAAPDSRSAALVQQQGKERELTRDSLERVQVVAQAVNAADSDYVLVEATAAQLKSVLAEFDRHPELFLSVNVEPAPAAPEQRMYAAYNRSRPAGARARSEQASRQPSSEGNASFESTLDEKQPEGKLNKRRQAATVLGRAQRVMLLPQFAQPSAVDGVGQAGQAAAMGPSSRQYRSSNGVVRSADQAKGTKELKVKKSEEPLAAEAKKPAATVESEVQPAVPAEKEVRPDYQQALFIFRRVHPPAASSPASKAEQ